MVFFHREITVSAEIKQNNDWLRPCCPNGHTHFSVFKRGCSGLWASGQFGFYTDFVCVWSRSFLPANKVLLHSALKTPGDFLIFEIFWTNEEKRSRYTTLLPLPSEPLPQRSLLCRSTLVTKQPCNRTAWWILANPITTTDFFTVDLYLNFSKYNKKIFTDYNCHCQCKQHWKGQIKTLSLPDGVVNHSSKLPFIDVFCVLK